MRIIAALLACLLLALPAAAQKRIALSFDDAPRGAGAFLDPDARAKKLTAALKRAGVKQAVFFVNPGNIGQPGHGDGVVNLDRYVKAGHVLANHSWAHPKLGNTDATAYLADLDRAEAWLKARPGYRPWFRFPVLDEGGKDKVKRDAIRAGLKARGLING